ncbi:Uncharacterised protein [uncultured archaeon]|nr:Uncharacterised protein [uncultured archaeon]
MKKQKTKHSKKKGLTKEQENQSEKISELVTQIGIITVQVQELNLANKKLKEDVAFCKGHIREKETKINMIKSIVGANK